MKTPIFKDSGQFKVVYLVPEIPATFDPENFDPEGYKKVLAFNAERDKDIPLPKMSQII